MQFLGSLTFSTKIKYVLICTYIGHHSGVFFIHMKWYWSKIWCSLQQFWSYWGGNAITWGFWSAKLKFKQKYVQPFPSLWRPNKCVPVSCIHVSSGCGMIFKGFRYLRYFYQKVVMDHNSCGGWLHSKSQSSHVSPMPGVGWCRRGLGFCWKWLEKGTIPRCDKQAMEKYNNRHANILLDV